MGRICMEKSKDLRVSILVVLTYLAMVVINALANILPIGGMNTGSISDSYPNLFAPSGLTFSIWGVIYLLLALYCIYQFKDKRSTIGILFSTSSLANSLWIFSWHYRRIGLSVLLMLIILIALIAINLKLQNQQLKGFSYYALQVPFSVYFGWITVATIANITTLLVAIGWNGFGLSEQIWTALTLIVGVIIALLWALKYQDIPYLLVLIWAYLGILIKHISDDGFAKAYSVIIACVAVSLFLFSFALVLLFLKKRKNT